MKKERERVGEELATQGLRGHRLKTVTYVLILLLFLLFAVGSGGLVFMTNRMHDEARLLRAGASGVRAAQALKVALLEFSRTNALVALTDDREFELQSARQEAVIETDLDRLALVEGLSFEHVRGAKEKVRYYLATRKRLARKRSLERAIEESTGPLDSALASINTLIQGSVERADQALSASAEMDELANRLALAELLFGVVVLVMISVGMLHYLYRPIQEIYSAIASFTGGEKKSRARRGGVSELQLIAERFNSLAEQTVDLNRKRVQFLAGTAHDLRNPLTALKTAVLLLKNRFQDLSEAQRVQNLELIERQITRMENLTSSLLDSVRIESGEFSLKMSRIDITRLVEDVIQLWSSAAEKHRLTLTTSAQPILLDCDPLRVEQIITNLISNAIKYSPQGGAIEARVQVAGETVEVSIRDHGMGISPEDLKTIFEPFKRTRSSQELVPGIGIGLWVTKRLVEAHRGQIDVESTVGQGSLFKVTLPTRCEDTIETSARF